MYKFLLLIFFSACCFSAANAQKRDTLTVKVKTKADSIKLKADSMRKAGADTTVSTTYIPKIKKEKVFHPDTNHSVHKAVIRSLLVPGLGQVYNRKYWKVPIIYGGLGLLGAVVIFNESNYKLFLQLAKYREHGITAKPGDPYYAQTLIYTTAVYSDQSIYDASDAYNRDRDLGVFGIIALWGINVIDSYIDAKFIHSYTVDNNLSMRVTPGVINQPMYAFNSSGTSFIPGIKITFTLR
jgi:hypothetical protein